MDRRKLELEVAAPFSLRATALGHGWHECAPMSWCEGGGCLQWLTREGSQVRRISVLQRASSRQRVTLEVLLEGRELTNASEELARRECVVSLGLASRLDEFHELCRAHPLLHVIPKLGAGRLLRNASMTENILKAICGTNVNWDQAVKMINRLAQLGPLFPHFRNLTAWPTCREILKAGDSYVRGVARLGYRTEAILKLCQESVTGDAEHDGQEGPRKRTPSEARGSARAREGIEAAAGLEALDALARTEPTPALRKRLLGIRGVGPATAGFLLSILGHHDHLSIDSATLAHVTRLHLGGRKKATAKQVEAIYEPYGKWKNLVYWFENWIHWGTARSMIAEL
ncbi:MAG: hypothetical protein IT449_18000 [Phycisphaerales bacterium]|nr:hypothetical protein [Phycisphaerales bacterium]